MAWTPWRKVADKLFWYTDHALRVPVCFELGLADPMDLERLTTVYADAARGEHHALLALERGEGRIAPRIHEALARGQELYLRSRGAPTLEQAQALLREVLSAEPHPWNDPRG